MLKSDQLKVFVSIKNSFKKNIALWGKKYPGLLDELEKIKKEGNSKSNKTGQKNSYTYTLENAIVYNIALENISENSNIKYIIVGDNPGKSEQLNANQTYLIGQAGKLARNVMIEKCGLIENFEEEVIILNKTPVHTVKTSDLKKLKTYWELIEGSQKYMAEMAYNLHKLINCELWIIGYTELKKGKVFSAFLHKITSLYANESKGLKNKVAVFRHFSTNSFLIDYRKRYNESLGVLQNLNKIGKELYRKEYMGW